MLTNATHVPAPAHRTRNIQIVYLPMPKPAPPRAARPRPAPAAKGAITLPQLPEELPYSDDGAARALGLYRDCDPSRLADLTPQERERCARVWAVLPNTNDTDPTIDLALRRQWTADIIEKGRIAEGPFHKCIGTQRSRLGLGCWLGLDH